MICTYREVVVVTCKHKEEVESCSNKKVMVEDTCSHKEANSCKEGKNRVVYSSKE